MEAATKLNSMQQFMLQLFNREIDKKQEQEIKQLLATYFAEQVDIEMDKIWKEKNLSQKDLDEALNSHKRTHYNS